MTLPVVAFLRAVVPVGDAKVEVRGLARSEAHYLPTFKDNPVDAEAFILSKGADVSLEEAKGWIDVTPSDAVDAVLDKILELSGLTEGADKSGVPGVRDAGE